MIVSGNRRLNNFIKYDSASGYAFNIWLKIIREVSWQTATDISKTFNQAECVDGFWFFNVAGKYRLVAKVWLDQERLRIFRIMPIDEAYDPADWKTSAEKYQVVLKRRRYGYVSNDKSLDELDQYADATYERLEVLSEYDAGMLRMESIVIGEYEHRNHPLPADTTYPFERLKFLCAENQLTQAHLSKFLSISLAEVAEIYDGKRELTNSQVPLLARYFKVNPTLFGAVNSYGHEF